MHYAENQLILGFRHVTRTLASKGYEHSSLIFFFRPFFSDKGFVAVCSLKHISAR